MLAFEVFVLEACLPQLALDLSHLALVAAVLRLQTLPLSPSLFISAVSLNAKVNYLETLLMEASSQRLQLCFK